MGFFTSFFRTAVLLSGNRLAKVIGYTAGPRRRGTGDPAASDGIFLRLAGAQSQRQLGTPGYRLSVWNRSQKWRFESSSPHHQVVEIVEVFGPP